MYSPDPLARGLADRASQLQLLVLIAILAGGGGVAYGFANLVVQLAAIAVLAVNAPAVRGLWQAGTKPVALLCFATLALPLMQLVPLPHAVWIALPGRQLADESLLAVDAMGWFPVSLDSARTLVAFLGLLLPFAVLALGLSLGRSTLVAVCRTVIALALAGFALGAVQVLSAGQSGLLYPENPMPGVMFSTFANRNSAGLFMVCCLILLCALPLGHARQRELIVRVIAGVLLTLGVLLTQSRSSMALLAIPALYLTLRLASAAWARRSANALQITRTTGVAAAALIAAVFAAAMVLLPDSRIMTGIERFSQTADARTVIWEDARFAAKRYWPAGTGMGTFDEVFQVDESLEYLSTRTAGRAHNDYLEIAIEAGAFGLALVAMWAAFVLWQAIRARNSAHRWLAWGCAAILACIALQSIVDYPLRNQAMLGFAALMVALLTLAANPDRELEP